MKILGYVLFGGGSLIAVTAGAKMPKTPIDPEQDSIHDIQSTLPDATLEELEAILKDIDSDPQRFVAHVGPVEAAEFCDVLITEMLKRNKDGELDLKEYLDAEREVRLEAIGRHFSSTSKKALSTEDMLAAIPQPHNALGMNRSERRKNESLKKRKKGCTSTNSFKRRPQY